MVYYRLSMVKEKNGNANVYYSCNSLIRVEIIQKKKFLNANTKSIITFRYLNLHMPIGV